MKAADFAETHVDADESEFDALEALSSVATATAALLLRDSGLYRRRPESGRLPIARRDELRLDVDGRYPQHAASGTLRDGLANRMQWMARLQSTGPATWSGSIVYRDRTPAMPPYTQVEISVLRTGPHQPRRARVGFSGGSTVPITQLYDYVSASFDPVEFEFDSTPDANPSLAIQTHAHPNHPPGMPIETLSIAKVYERAGFNVSVAPQGPPIPVAGAGVDGVWSDTEMHDAMQAHWSRFRDQAQWAMWVFHAAMHESGRSLGGVMFDDIGPNHRQGTAIFTESFISHAPAGDPAAVAWVARMRFWTACHEMGHAFNLAHSWQKSLGTPWLPISDEPEARSFMNYPYNVSGGETAFFEDFGFRFSDPELLFMRHAPRSFVQMGNADWFDHHGFEEASVSREPKLALVVRVNREKPLLQFMEPAVVELKLTNISRQPMIVPKDLLEDSHHLTLVAKRGRDPARSWSPFASACHEPEVRVLAPGDSMYAPIFLGAGKGGWMVAEPGVYQVQACLHLPDGEDIVSAPMELRVAPPAGYDEEMMAQDLFTQDVGRALAFDGTRELSTANQALRETVDRFPTRAVSTHARVALGMPMRRPGKVLRGPVEAPAIEAMASRPEEARALLSEALINRQDGAAATLGHVEFGEYAQVFAGWLAREGEMKEARELMTTACAALEKRAVKPAVVAELRRFGEGLAADAPSRPRRPGKAKE